MILGRFASAALGALAAALLSAPSGLQAEEAGKTIKIGVVYDLTGPFAGGDSELQYLGAKIMIDWFNERGGIVRQALQVVDRAYLLEAGSICATAATELLADEIIQHAYLGVSPAHRT
jgi:ABC-type branched-subunit amino acid transport system substrate-binding protein